MQKYYFSAKIQQEFSSKIFEQATNLGVSKENIILNRQGCDFLHVGIYIKFGNVETLNKFRDLELPGIIEIW